MPVDGRAATLLSILTTSTLPFLSRCRPVRYDAGGGFGAAGGAVVAAAPDAGALAVLAVAVAWPATADVGLPVAAGAGGAAGAGAASCCADEQAARKLASAIPAATIVRGAPVLGRPRPRSPANMAGTLPAGNRTPSRHPGPIPHSVDNRAAWRLGAAARFNACLQ